MSAAAERMKRLADDFDEYEDGILKDMPWKREMQRTILVEMEGELEKLRAICNEPRRDLRPRRRWTSLLVKH